MEKTKKITQDFIDLIIKISKKILPTKLVEIETKFLTVEVVLYLFFGVLTTVVNIGLFAILVSFFDMNENISNAIAIIAAVLFAYFTNKGLVFNSTASTTKEKMSEFIKFMLGRGLTMIVEFLGFYLLFNIASVPKLISKTLIIINFFKLFYSFIIIITIFIIIFFTPISNNLTSTNFLSNTLESISSSSNQFIWPIPRFNKNQFKLWKKKFANCICIFIS